MEPTILYEDDDILVVNKPAGLVVHADGRTTEPTVVDWFLARYPEAEHVGEPPIELKEGGEIRRPGIVHRIDRETSGALLLAKTHHGYDTLKEEFAARTIGKKYMAFLYGNLKEDHGTISFPISRSTADFRKWVARTRIQNAEGRGELREAVTYFRVLARAEGTTLVEAEPKTGRTHQIRVHFKALQRPVVCDPLYAAGQPKLLGFERLALHARAVTFTNTPGEEVTITAPYPEDFQGAFTAVGYVPRDLP